MKQDLACLIARLAFGGTMLVAHGIPKLMNFSQKMNSFPDPLGVGNSLSLGLTIFAEVLCAAFLVLGLLTRWVSIPLLITMGVAFIMVHGSHPFSKKELAFAYFCGFLLTGLLGSGRIGLDHLLKKKI